MNEKEILERTLMHLPKIEMQNPKEIYVQVIGEDEFYYREDDEYDNFVLAKVERVHMQTNNVDAWINVINGRAVEIDARLKLKGVTVLSAWLPRSKLLHKKSIDAILADAFKQKVKKIKNEMKKEAEERRLTLIDMEMAVKNL